MDLQCIGRALSMAFVFLVSTTNFFAMDQESVAIDGNIKLISISSVFSENEFFKIDFCISASGHVELMASYTSIQAQQVRTLNLSLNGLYLSREDLTKSLLHLFEENEEVYASPKTFY